MTSQQFQRFLSWTSDNRHVIERLQVQLALMLSFSDQAADGHCFDQVLPTSSVSPSEENLAFEFHED